MTLTGRCPEPRGATPRALDRIARAGLRLAGVLFGVLALTVLAAAAAEPPVPEDIAYCLNCHADKDASVKLKDGASMSLFVDAQEFTHSVHGSQLICTDCHEGYKDNHPSGASFPSRRAYAISSYAICKKCHFDTYTRTLESVHYELLKAGVDSAPVCSDCHGAHNIQNPHEKRAMVSRSCATCHDTVYAKYRQSVHGKALVDEGNRDVPACADCHTHHQIQQPGTARFKLASPEICARCHADGRLMAKYGISPAVVTTYLSDFHGVTASLSRSSVADPARLVVTCVDCHGVHDIMSPKLKGAAAMRVTVENVCAKCHPKAATTLPAAWLSHYEPSLRHAPLVFLVDVFYKIFIPFVVIGLVLHILLHLYRVSAGR